MGTSRIVIIIMQFKRLAIVAGVMAVVLCMAVLLASAPAIAATKSTLLAPVSQQNLPGNDNLTPHYPHVPPVAHPSYGQGWGYGGIWITNGLETQTQPPVNPVVVSFIANPTTVEPGQAVTLTWSTSNASSVTISQIGLVEASGSTTVTPSSSTSYTLTATGDLGTIPASSTAIVTIKPWTPPVIVVGQSSIQSGKSTTLSWNAPGAAQVSISGAGIFSAAGSTEVSPAETTTYNLTATYTDGTSQSASATLIVEAAEPSYLLYGVIGFGLIGLLALAAAVVVYLRAKKLTAHPAVQYSNVESVPMVPPPSPISTIPSSSPLATNEENTRVSTVSEQPKIGAAQESIISEPKPRVRIKRRKAKSDSAEGTSKDDKTEGPIDE
jgi:hypothetical protein